jgi:putative aldouronate transport system substrate-binding protein
MKRLRSVLCLVLLVSMSVLLFVGCSGKTNDTTQTTSQSNATTSSDGSPTAKWKFDGYKPEITLTQNRQQSSEMAFQPGDDMNNNSVTRWIKDELGIICTAKWVVSDSSADQQKLNLAFASNDLPDLISASAENIGKMAKANALLPLDELIDQYASPLTKQIISEFKNASNNTYFLSYSYNKAIYGFPNCVDLWSAAWNNLWIRKDVLDELKMPVPSTLQQFEDVLAAYKKAYPDNIGLTMGYDRLTGSQVVMNAFDAHPHMWVENSDGNLIYGSITPDVKKGLEVLRRWYEKGYLDKEFITKDMEKAIESFNAGKGLAIYGQWWFVDWPFSIMWANAKDAVMDPVTILKGPEGKQTTMFDIFTGRNATAISAKCENPEALIYMLNEEIDSYYRNDENLRKTMKEQGYEFKYPVTARQEPSNPDEPNTFLRKFNYEMQGFGYLNDGEDYGGYLYGITFYERAHELYDAYREVQQTLNTGSGQAALGRRASFEYPYWKEHPERARSLFLTMDLFDSMNGSGFITYNKYMAGSTATMVEKSTYLNKLEDETFSKIIMGEIPLDDFDKFVENWKKSGGDDITKEVNAWYVTNK